MSARGGSGRWFVRVAIWFLMGAALWAFSYTYLVRTDQQQADLLTTGTKVTGTVVENLLPTSGDNGRLMVRYSTPSGPQTATVWLSSVSHEQTVGTTVTLYVDPQQPGRVRTLLDDNPPSTAHDAAQFLSLVGGVIAVIQLLRVPFGIRRRLKVRQFPAAESSTQPTSDTETSTRPTSDTWVWQDSEGKFVSGSALPVGHPPVPEDGQPAKTTTQADVILRGFRWGLGVRIAATVVLLVSPVTMFLVLQHRDASTLKSYTSTEGVAANGFSGSSDLANASWVNVKYQAAGQTMTEKLVGIGPGNAPQGTPVDVLYNPQNPAEFRTVAYTNDYLRIPALWFLPPTLLVPSYLYWFGGLGGVVIGLSVLLGRGQVRTWRSWLAASSWQTWHVVGGSGRLKDEEICYSELSCRDPLGNESRVVVKFRPADRTTGTDDIFGMGTSNELLNTAGATLLLVPGDDHSYLALPDDGERPFEVDLPSSEKTYLHWQEKARTPPGDATHGKDAPPPAQS